MVPAIPAASAPSLSFVLAIVLLLAVAVGTVVGVAVTRLTPPADEAPQRDLREAA